MIQSWKLGVDRLLKEVQAQADNSAKTVIEALLGAGPLHNVEAARRVLSPLAGQGEERE